MVVSPGQKQQAATKFKVLLQLHRIPVLASGTFGIIQQANASVTQLLVAVRSLVVMEFINLLMEVAHGASCLLHPIINHKPTRLLISHSTWQCILQQEICTLPHGGAFIVRRTVEQLSLK